MGTFPSDDELEMSHDRKSHKQEMEKRRRARINDSLGQLKSLVLQALKRDETRYSKLEKADILEMTVKYLRNVRRHELYACVSKEPAMAARYIAGYNECATEITRLLGSYDGIGIEIRNRILAHLASCFSTMQHRTMEQSLSVSPPAYPVQPLPGVVPGMPLHPNLSHVGGGGAPVYPQLLHPRLLPHPQDRPLPPHADMSAAQPHPAFGHNGHRKPSPLNLNLLMSPTKSFTSDYSFPHSAGLDSMRSASSSLSPSTPSKSSPLVSPVASSSTSSGISPSDVSNSGRSSPMWRPW